MAENISVSHISNYVGQEVTIKGWVYNRTDKGKLVFLVIRDGSGFVQCVAFKGDLEHPGGPAIRLDHDVSVHAEPRHGGLAENRLAERLV